MLQTSGRTAADVAAMLRILGSVAVLQTSGRTAAVAATRLSVLVELMVSHFDTWMQSFDH